MQQTEKNREREREKSDNPSGDRKKSQYLKNTDSF